MEVEGQRKSKKKGEQRKGRKMKRERERDNVLSCG